MTTTTGREGSPRTVRHRLDAQDRRKQLIGIGLRLLTRRPLHQITIDEVAAAAGISRSLLFHYFPTKQDYYVAVVRAASRRLLRQIAPDQDGPAGTQIHAIVVDYVRYIERRREPYVALFRSPGADDWVRSIHEETQEALARRVIETLPDELRPDAVRLVVRAWWSFAEELAITWTGSAPALTELLEETLYRVIEAAGGARP